MYGLLGKHLSHSFSKDIHEYLHPMEYKNYETDDLATFFDRTPFKGINVTIPYKKAVLDYCDMLDDSVKATGVVNTIIKQSSFKKAYNTDYLALIDLIKSQFPTPSLSDIAIIGNGATKESIVAALKTLGYNTITIYARHPKENEKLVNSIATTHTILINATPMSMYPNNFDAYPIDLNSLPKLTLVFDVIYNPLKTPLLLQADQLNIKTLNGLSMLVTQAVYANQYFFNTVYSNALYEKLYKRMLLSHLNITLIGLPFSGKTTYGKLLGNLFNKTFIDIDNHIELEEKMSIMTLFEEHGEPYFRRLEKTHTLAISKQFNQIISTGGGVVLNDDVMQALKQNSIVIYLDLQGNLMQTIRFHSRPHVKHLDDLLTLKKNRHTLYKKYADVIINKDTLDRNIIMNRIEVKIHDYINHQWTQSKPFR